MSQKLQSGPQTATELLGELHPLMAQLGSADGLLTLSAASASLRLPRVASAASLEKFLRAYRAQILLPLELPAISQAWLHASRNEVRELIALDQKLARHPFLREFASASRRVGRTQLEKLRPLRDQRVVRRYLQAVHAGQAHGWHTLVFGLTLALYSLPVRQGLMSYSRQTLRGFIQAAARPLHLSQEDCQVLFDQLCENLPQELGALVQNPHPSV